MLNSIIKRELNYINFIVPICFRYKSESNVITELDDKAHIEKKTKSIVAEDNPYYLKYAEKIRLKQKNFKLKEEKQDKLTNEVKEAIYNIKESKSCNLANENKPNNEAYFRLNIKPKSLNDIVHLPLLAKHTATEIEKIWTDYHYKKEGYLFAVIPSEKYKEIYENGKSYPIFIYPLPKEANNSSNNEYQFFLGQFNNHEIYFTPLAMYHVHKENALPVIYVIHYPELISEKGIVLMQGKFDEKIIKCTEAKCLLYQVQLYYSNNLENFKLLHKFNMEPDSFDYLEIIKVFEKGIN